jgi:peptide/nickel transport system substrate-binding protein
MNRIVISLFLAAMVAVLVAACGKTAEAPAPIIIEKEIVVEKDVIKEVIVEREVEKKVVQTVVNVKQIITTVAPEEGTTADEGIYGGRLLITGQASIKTLDPDFSAAYVTAATANQHIFEQLFAWNQKMEPTPGAVQSWNVNATATKWTLTIREGMKFHDGTDVTADDVIASYERIMASGAGYNAGITKRLLVEGGMKKQDNLTLTIELSEPFNFIPTGLSIPFRGSVTVKPKRIVDLFPTGKEDMGHDNIIGSGPYRVKSWFVGDRIVLERFPDYNSRSEPASYMAGAKLAFMDELHWLEIPNEETKIAGLKTGEWDFMDSVALDFVADLEATNGVNIGWYKPGHYSNSPFNHAVAPTDNKLVRQAILAAVDAEEIMSSLGPPSTWNLCGQVFICNAVWNSDSAIELYNQANPERAKELLAEAGYNGEPIHIKNPTDYGTITPIGPVLKSQLEAAGINVEMPAQDWAGIISIIMTSQGWNMFTNWNTHRSIFSPAFHTYTAGKGLSSYDSPIMQELHARFIQETDPVVMQEIVDDMQATMYDELPWVPFGQFYMPSPYRDYVKNFPEIYLGAPNYNNVWIEK